MFDLLDVANAGLEKQRWEVELSKTSFLAIETKITKRDTPHVVVVSDCPFRLVSYGVWLRNMGCVVDLCRDTRRAVLLICEKIGRFRGKKAECVYDAVFADIRGTRGIDMVNFVGQIRTAEEVLVAKHGVHHYSPIVCMSSSKSSATKLLEQGYDHFIRPPFVSALPGIRALLLPLLFRDRGRAKINKATANYPKIQGMLQEVASNLYDNKTLKDMSSLDGNAATSKLTQCLADELAAMKHRLDEKEVKIRDLSERDAGQASLAVQLKATTAELIKFKVMYKRRVDALVHEKILKFKHGGKSAAADFTPEEMTEMQLDLLDKVDSLTESNEYLSNELTIIMAQNEELSNLGAKGQRTHITSGKGKPAEVQTDARSEMVTAVQNFECEDHPNQDPSLTTLTAIANVCQTAIFSLQQPDPPAEPIQTKPRLALLSSLLSALLKEWLGDFTATSQATLDDAPKGNVKGKGKGKKKRGSFVENKGIPGNAETQAQLEKNIAEIAELKQELEKYQSEVSDIGKELKAAEDSNEQLEESVTTLTKKVEVQRRQLEEHASLNSELREAELREAKLKQTIKTMDARTEIPFSEFKALQDNFTKQANLLSAATQQIERLPALESQVDTLQQTALEQTEAIEFLTERDLITSALDTARRSTEEEERKKYYDVHKAFMQLLAKKHKEDTKHKGGVANAPPSPLAHKKNMLKVDKAGSFAQMSLVMRADKVNINSARPWSEVNATLPPASQDHIQSWMAATCGALWKDFPCKQLTDAVVLTMWPKLFSVLGNAYYELAKTPKEDANDGDGAEEDHNITPKESIVSKRSSVRVVLPPEEKEKEKEAKEQKGEKEEKEAKEDKDSDEEEEEEEDETPPPCPALDMKNLGELVTSFDVALPMAQSLSPRGIGEIAYAESAGNTPRKAGSEEEGSPVVDKKRKKGFAKKKSLRLKQLGSVASIRKHKGDNLPSPRKAAPSKTSTVATQTDSTEQPPPPPPPPHAPAQNPAAQPDTTVPPLSPTAPPPAPVAPVAPEQTRSDCPELAQPHQLSCTAPIEGSCEPTEPQPLSNTVPPSGGSEGERSDPTEREGGVDAFCESAVSVDARVEVVPVECAEVGVQANPIPVEIVLEGSEVETVMPFVRQKVEHVDSSVEALTTQANTLHSSLHAFLKDLAHIVKIPALQTQVESFSKEDTALSCSELMIQDTLVLAGLAQTIDVARERARCTGRLLFKAANAITTQNRLLKFLGSAEGAKHENVRAFAEKQLKKKQEEIQVCATERAALRKSQKEDHTKLVRERARLASEERRRVKQKQRDKMTARVQSHAPNAQSPMEESLQGQSRLADLASGMAMQENTLSKLDNRSNHNRIDAMQESLAAAATRTTAANALYKPANRTNNKKALSNRRDLPKVRGGRNEALLEAVQGQLGGQNHIPMGLGKSLCGDMNGDAAMLSIGGAGGGMGGMGGVGGIGGVGGVGTRAKAAALSSLKVWCL